MNVAAPADQQWGHAGDDGRFEMVPPDSVAQVVLVVWPKPLPPSVNPGILHCSGQIIDRFVYLLPLLSRDIINHITSALIPRNAGSG